MTLVTKLCGSLPAAAWNREYLKTGYSGWWPEFAIIHQGTEVRQEAVSLAERILREAQAELGTTERTEKPLHGGGMRLSCTIGIAISTSGSTVDQLMSEADWAMCPRQGQIGSDSQR